jgi:hypothetical protein
MQKNITLCTGDKYTSNIGGMNAQEQKKSDAPLKSKQYNPIDYEQPAS